MTQGARTLPLPLFKDSGKVFLSANLVVLLESFENAKMNRKLRVSGDFRGSKLQNFPGEHAPEPQWRSRRRSLVPSGVADVGWG